MPLYSVTEIRKNINHIVLKRTFELWKVSDKQFYFEYSVVDLFDCDINYRSGTLTYSASHQKFLEKGIKKNKKTPVELFSTEEHKFHHDRW